MSDVKLETPTPGPRGTVLSGDDSVKAVAAGGAERGEAAIETGSKCEADVKRPARRRRRGKLERQKRTKELDAEAAFQKRLRFLLERSQIFPAWMKENHPAIWYGGEVTAEIVKQFDDYELATLRQRHSRPSESPCPEVAEFAENAFNYAGQNNWPQEFRSWAAGKHQVQRKEDVTRAIMDEWHNYELAQFQAHHARADFDYKELDPQEYEAGVDEWLRQKHRYFEGLPNTKAGWAALKQRRADRIVRERAEAERRAAKEKAEAAEHQRKRTQLSELKAFKLPLIEGRVPKLLNVGNAREEHDKQRLQLWQIWRAQFNDLPDAAQAAWEAYHHADVDDLSNDFPAGLDGSVYLTPYACGPKVNAECADAVAAGLRDPEFTEFRAFSEGVRQEIEALHDKLQRLLNPPPDAYVPHRGYTLDEIEDEDEHYVLDGAIPEGLAVLYGAPKVGKSAWAQKLSACVTSGVPFDGVEIAHGRALCISCDTGARRGAVKRRVSQILKRLGVAANKDLVIVEDPVILNDAASVASLLEQNPGKFPLVVIDPLYQCVTGSLVQDAVMMEAIKGLSAIQRATGAAVLLIHHEPRNSQHLFGSMLLDAALDAQIHVERDKEVVTVKVELLKNGKPAKRPLTYQMEDSYLAATAIAVGAKGSSTVPPSAEKGRHAQFLARFPAKAIRETEARKLVQDLLTGKNPTAQRQQWHRTLKAMVEAGDVIRRQGMVRPRDRDEP